MSDGVIVAIITSGASLLLAVVNGVIAALQRRAQKKSGTDARLENIEKKVDKLTKHGDLQYLSLLRLTVMDSDMPMSERLIAGQEYLDRGGNGDVRHFYEHLKAQVDGKEADDV
jgi:hypothetical protein